VSYVAHFFERKTSRGAQRYSCEIVLSGAERIILDDDSMSSLSTKVARLAPEMMYSRMLAANPRAAA
jgi:hypothetical protein